MPFHFLNFKSRLCVTATLTLMAMSLFGCQQSAKPTGSGAASRPVTTPAPATISTTNESLPAIVAFGDSLTAGFGLSQEQSYTSLLQRKLDENGYRYRVVNAGVSGDTSAGGARRIDWALQSGNVKFLVLELGGNDGLRGLPVNEMKKNLEQIIQRAQSAGVTVLLAGMEAPQISELNTRANSDKRFAISPNNTGPRSFLLCWKALAAMQNSIRRTASIQMLKVKR